MAIVIDPQKDSNEMVNNNLAGVRQSMALLQQIRQTQQENAFKRQQIGLERLKLDREYQLQTAQAKFFSNYANMFGQPGQSPQGQGLSSPDLTQGSLTPQPYVPMGGISSNAFGGGMPGGSSIPNLPMGLTGANIAGINIGPNPIAMKQVESQIGTQGSLNTEQGKNILEAGKSVSRDSANLNMITGVFKNATDLYDKAAAGGLAGNAYKKILSDAITSGKIDEKWAMNAGVPASAIQAAGAFTSARNEMLTRMQPIMSEQFGKEGSNRIMDSLLKIANSEVPDLSSGRNSFVGKMSGTIKNLYRFSKAGIDYASRLGVNANDIAKMSPKDVDKLALKMWNDKSIKLTKEEETALNDAIGYATNSGAGSIDSDELLKKWSK